MPAIDELFSEYVRMRENGLDAIETLRTLRQYIEPLSQPEREELARHLRGWENKLITPEEKRQQDVPDTATLAEDVERNPVWLQCPNCGRNNRAKDVFCYACGRILDLREAGASETITFTSNKKKKHNDEYFGQDSLLILKSPNGKTRFEIRPQLSQNAMVIGRSTDEQTVHPDIDLSDAQGAAFGVSRLHLSLAYDETLEVIQIHDLGSANGTAVNGQKIHPAERRILRNGDEMWLGKLILRVQYQHPDPEISG